MTIIEALNRLEKKLSNIAGNWNGDESGLAEDRARASLDVIEKINEIREIIEELNI